MDDINQFIELVNNVCSCPQMFTANGTFGEVSALFFGIYIAAKNSPIAADDERTLSRFVNARLFVPDKFSWDGAIKLVSEDDKSAIRKLRELLIEFVTLRKTHTMAEIRDLALRYRDEYAEPEPVAVWREFLVARYSCDQEQIEPLILEHPQAAVLWSGVSAPNDVVEQLMEISDSYTVSIVSGSLESGKVSLATEVGIIEAFLVDGNWRIDASLFIEMDLQRDQ